jgi:transposase-like protein
MDNLARKEIIDQAPSRSSLDETRKGFKSVTEFLDHVEMGVRAFVRWMMQAYAEDEFLRFIGAKPYERTPLRKDRRNGSRSRQLETRFGLIEDLRLPRGRKAGTSYSTILGRYRRQDERINQIVSEMFLRGISTRKVGKISQLLWGSDVSPAEVSRMNKSVKKELIRWLNRPIAEKFAYLIIDGVYFKVHRKRTSRQATLCAVGITENGQGEHVGFIQGHRESQKAWESLLTQLVRRGLDPKGVLMVSSDGCPGIVAAIRTVLPYSDHQRCLFHKMDNLKAKCPKTEWSLIKAKLDRIYYAANLMEAKAQAKSFTQEYPAILPALVDCLEKHLDACLTYMSHPANRWKHIRTINLIERSFKEVKRRVKVMEQFPTEESCIRILFTLLQAQNEVWEGRPIKHFGNYTS